MQLQASAFFDKLSARERLETFGALYGVPAAHAAELLKVVGLTDRADTRDDKLSGGQRQRLSIPCALVHDPDVVFLDEPTRALDPQARRNLWDLLGEIQARGKTILYTTHHRRRSQGAKRRPPGGGGPAGRHRPAALCRQRPGRLRHHPEHHRAAIAQANLDATGQRPRFNADCQQVEAANTRPIQYLTPGILSWGIATSAVFGAALTLVTWRRKQLLRRIRLSPAPAWTVVGARVGVSLVTALAQAALFVGVAVTPPFGLRLSDQWWLAIPLLLVGALSCLSIGLLVGAIARTEEAAQAMANLVVLPMAFLSGTFLDVSQLPPWLRTASNALPLRHLTDGMLDVLVRGKGANALLVPTAALLGFALALTFAATRLFRWDDV